MIKKIYCIYDSVAVGSPPFTGFGCIFYCRFIGAGGRSDIDGSGYSKNSSDFAAGGCC